MNNTVNIVKSEVLSDNWYTLRKVTFDFHHKNDLDFLFETESLKGESTYLRLKKEYDTLSKRINKFTQWVEENLNQ